MRHKDIYMVMMEVPSTAIGMIRRMRDGRSGLMEHRLEKNLADFATHLESTSQKHGFENIHIVKRIDISREFVILVTFWAFVTIF